MSEQKNGLKMFFKKNLFYLILALVMFVVTGVGIALIITSNNEGVYVGKIDSESQTESESRKMLLVWQVQRFRFFQGEIEHPKPNRNEQQPLVLPRIRSLQWSIHRNRFHSRNGRSIQNRPHLYIEIARSSQHRNAIDSIRYAVSSNADSTHCESAEYYP